MKQLNRIDRALLAARTVCHLTPSQLFFWPLRRLQRRSPLVVRTSGGSSHPIRIQRIAECVAQWGPGDGATRLARADEVCSGNVTLLNHTESLKRVDWNVRRVSHLWNYTLHYFGFAVDLAWASRRTGDPKYVRRFEELALSWIDATRPGTGDGWDPYVISARLVNWTYAMSLFGNSVSSRLSSTVWPSVHGQMGVLRRRMEYHLRANHLQRNYMALLVAGLATDGPASAACIRDGSRGLWRELSEQVLPDGGHFERSPMYHAMALADFLEAVDVSRACGVEVPAWVEARIAAMLAAFGVLSRETGKLHLFNDAANDIAPSRQSLDSLARRVIGRGIPAPAGAFALPNTGYYGFAGETGCDRILVDAGEPGPRYQSGHAHCGLLSFELDVEGRQVVVDSGTSGYADDPLREYQRSTRAHNTVMIGGKEQSEVWGVFRVARRARLEFVEHSSTAGGWQFRGAYRPYHLREAMHERIIDRLDRGAWCVTDRVHGATGLPLRSFLHLHPDYAVKKNGDSWTATAADGSSFEIVAVGFDGAVLRRGVSDPPQGWYSPSFGISGPATVIEFEIEANMGRAFGYTIKPREL